MFVPLCKPDFNDKDTKTIEKILKAGDVSHGKYVGIFEKDFSKLIGTNFAISVNSCTSGLYCVSKYLKDKNNYKKKSNILVQSFTWNASVNTISLAGLTPKFLDINPLTLEVDLDEIKKKIDKNTVGIMIVHYAGRINKNISKISNYCKRNKLHLIEDCAETLNTSLNKKVSGSFGYGIFSFYGTKNISTFEGGMITTNDKLFYNWCKKFIAHGVDKTRKKKFPWNRDAQIPGQNFRLSNLQAAIGINQLKRSQYFKRKRQAVADLYYQFLPKEHLILPNKLSQEQNSYQMFPILLKSSRIRNKLISYLNSKNIGASVHFDPPVHKQGAYKNIDVSLKNTEEISSKIATLPISSMQTTSQTKFVINNIKKFFV